MTAEIDMVKGYRDDLPVKADGKKYLSSCLYRPDEDPETVIRIMKNGDGFPAVAKEMGISLQTLTRWRTQFPELEEACQAGLTLSQEWWERKAKESLVVVEDKDGPKTTFNTRLYTFTMASRFNQRERNNAVQVLVGENSDADKVNALIDKLHGEDI